MRTGREVQDLTPLARIEQLAAERGSGELICASETVEVHVYFQRGRIAWATDAARPLAFTRRLLETAQIDADIFQEILESCRREKRPLGETLIAWGVATHDEVRAALQHQIEMAVVHLRESGPLQMIFLHRVAQFETYDASLTFGLHEIFRKVKRVPSQGALVAVRPARGASVAPPSSPAERLSASLDGVAWVAAIDGAALDEASSAKVPASLVRDTLLDGADLVAVRAGRTTLAGVTLSGAESLWCLVAGATTVGAVVAALSELGDGGGPPSSIEEIAPSIALDWSTGPEEGNVGKVLGDFVERKPEVYAALVTDPRATIGRGRGNVRADDIVAVVERRSRALAAPELDPTDAVAVDEGMSQRRMMSAERRFGLFGAELAAPGGSRFVWLVLDRRCSKGIGWGYLTSLSRDLSRALRDARG